MTWSEQSPAERKARKQRRAQRRLRKDSNRAQFAMHQQMQAHAPTSSARDHAAHEWDVARKTIARIRDPVEQERQWRRLKELLAEFNTPATSPLDNARKE